MTLAASLWINPSRLRAIVFDVDGTLYRQASLRRAMALRLLRAHLSRPLAGLTTVRWLRAYRQAQERLRWRDVGGDPALGQLRLASQSAGVAPEALAPCIERWMQREPLALLQPRLQDGLRELLEVAMRRALRLAACSDYPAADKLAAMGIARSFHAVVSARDPDVQRLKPHPRQLEVALRRLGVRPEEALYVGDRPEVDAEAARRAGVACAIVGRRGWPGPGRLSFRELAEFIR